LFGTPGKTGVETLTLGMNWEVSVMSSTSYKKRNGVFDRRVRSR